MSLIYLAVPYILRACEKVIVLMLDGWEQSKGIAGEIEIARELGIPVEYHSIP